MGGAGVRIYEDLRTVQRRLGVVQAVVALLVAGLLVYFWHLQVIRGKYFRDLAENNRIRAVPIPAPRGPLFDRKGRILAENRSSFNVIVTTERKDELGDALERLARLISFDPGAVRERLNTRGGPRFRSVVVKADASDEDVATIEARRMEEPEASVDVVPLRSYPLGMGLAHLLGYVGEISDRQLESSAFDGLEPGSVVGQAGVELQYNRELMGRDGLRRIVVNSRGVEVTEAQRVPPVDGPSATLTIDLDLQAAVVEAMAGKSGSVIAIDPEQRRGAGLPLLARLRSQLVLDGHRQRGVGGAAQGPGEAAHEPADPGRLRAGLDLQGAERAGRAAGARDHAADALPLPGLPLRLQHRLPLPQGVGPRHGGPRPRRSPSAATCISTTSASGWRSSG